MAASSLSLRLLDSITDVPAAAWDALLPEPRLPFLRHAWFAAFEESGSASTRTGWEPSHLTLWRGEQLVAAAPAYRKFHSMGEYIYDFSWAHAAERMGIEYYPKLLVGAPLSPATAPRFLIAADEDAAATRKTLRDALVEVAKEYNCSSVHVLYPPDAEADELEAAGFARRATLQFHWRNPGYKSYAEFLSRFDSKRRHQLKHERAAAAQQGISIRTVRGRELNRDHADRAFGFYKATNEKNAWGRLQLNRDFFHRVFQTLGDSVEVVEAERDGRVIAGAFNLTSPERLYGRYWGCLEEHPFLHFNVCFYHSIDDCIQLGRRVFEPGAGGEHKIARGFEPTAVHSAHWIFNRKLDTAIRAFVKEERTELLHAVEAGQELAGLKR